MKFQDKLQILRKEKGLSQEKLAEIIGVSRQAVAKWELGQSYPDMMNLIAISQLFHMSMDRLVKDNVDENCQFDQTKNSFQTNNDMIDFLCRAKKSTYAGKGAEALPSRPMSHDLHYSEGPYTYIDSYLGGEKFAGEEALWWEGQPVWSMNYIGRIVADGFNGGFLDEVLSLVPIEYPYRGPLIYHNGDFSYHCIVNGMFEWFHGYEEIFCKDNKVYECMFHGGNIK
ncbi:transcriptional repressor DicA [compost metagenome]